MNKKVVFGSMIVGIIVIYVFFFTKPVIDSKAGLLMDASTGNILIAKNEQEGVPVASVSKMMTAYVILEAIEAGSIDWNELVVMSESANMNSQQAVQINVPTRGHMSVEDLFAALLIPSANNAAIALAEHIAGSEEQFAIMMNEKASAIGLSDETVFVNSTGLTIDNERNIMSAVDVATLAHRLMTDFPEVLDITKMPFYDIEHSGERIFNTNRLLFSNERNIYDERVDGLKTGYTNDAGYCFVSTAEAKDKRYITIILGADNEDMRFQETNKMLAYAFQPIYVPSIADLKSFIKTIWW